MLLAVSQWTHPRNRQAVFALRCAKILAAECGKEGGGGATWAGVNESKRQTDPALRILRVASHLTVAHLESGEPPKRRRRS